MVGIGYNDTRTASSLQLPITAEINTVNAEPYNGGLRLKKSGVLRYRTTGICWFGCNFYIRKNGYNISTLTSTTQPNICGEVYVNAGDIICWTSLNDIDGTWNLGKADESSPYTLPIVLTGSSAK